MAANGIGVGVGGIGVGDGTGEFTGVTPVFITWGVVVVTGVILLQADKRMEEKTNKNKDYTVVGVGSLDRLYP